MGKLWVYYKYYIQNFKWRIPRSVRVYWRIIMSDKSCYCHKKYRSDEEKKKLIHRLNRIEGQIRGLRGMLEDDAYCMDILVQSSAASAALTAFNRELLSTHIESCVVDGIRQGDDEKVEELLSILQKMIK